MAIYLRAPFLIARGTIAPMLARGFGRIVLLSSVAAYRGGFVGRTTPPPRPACTPPSLIPTRILDRHRGRGAGQSLRSPLQGDWLPSEGRRGGGE